jgi:hypothetical protein
MAEERAFKQRRAVGYLPSVALMYMLRPDVSLRHHDSSA